MDIKILIILIVIILLTLAIQIFAAIIAYKISHPKIYSLKQIVEEDSKGVEKLFDLKKYMKKGPLKKEKVDSCKYEIWGLEKNKKYVILVHGVSNRKERMLKYAKIWNDFGYNAVVFDGRGYNEHTSLGNSTFGYKEAELLNAIKADVENKNVVLSIGLHGESMGAATVFNWVKRFQRNKNVDFIVVESGYFSFSKPAIKGMRNKGIPKIIAKLMLFFVIRWLILISGANLLSVRVKKKHMKYFKMPILLINTRADSIVPLKEHERIVKMFDEEKVKYKTFEVEDSKHVRILTDEKNQKEWIKNLDEFIKGVRNEK
ncbi:alpha/beta hydrolase [Mycoplasma marinum]|uniref:Serine aminopeptidase S33 domain-containing protein n=1 Tax=Mycoplasma marinum TaxID=1937190 RepID=A0A4R0XJK1_9MOLU|nr:alpha/beta hydrolase [Mycoplasma marinum]TCG10816.1 hypothetical protein C4B24_03750 [Mycoplasma marinum]